MQELLLNCTNFFWCVAVKCCWFPWMASHRFSGSTALAMLCLTRAGNGCRWSCIRMDVALDAYKCKWMKELLNEAVWSCMVGGGSWSSRAYIDLICSLLMFKQLIISNPMTRLFLKWRRCLFYSCIIGLAIYAVGRQLTDFVCSPLMFSAKCVFIFSLWMPLW